MGVRVAHGWDADTATPLVLLQLRTDAGDVGLVSMTAELAQVLVDQVGAVIAIVRGETGQLGGAPSARGTAGRGHQFRGRS